MYKQWLSHLHHLLSSRLEDYVYWHVGENFTYEDAEDEIESNNYLGQKKFKRAYMYNFKNPVIFDIPKK